jgi:putative transposase
MHGKEIETNTGKSQIQNYLRELCPIAPNIVWRSDFIHIIFKGIHIYLATVLDDYTKEIVGYTLSYHHTKELILSAIQDAIRKTGGILPGYFHSDQGSEYTSYAVLAFLQSCNILVYMSSK